MGCWPMYVGRGGLGAGVRVWGRSRSWVGRQATAPSPLPGGGGRGPRSAGRPGPAHS